MTASVCRMPFVSLVAFQDRPGNFIFVRIPTEFGRYLRTDPCVAHVPCPYEHCGSTIGEPCKHKGKYTGGTHAVRRILADNRRRGKRLALPRMDVVDETVCDGARVTIKTGATP